MATLNLPLTSTFSTTAGVAFPSTPATAGATVLSTASEFRDLLGLGTAALDDSGDFATAAQGATADTALQPADIASGTITPRTGAIDLSGGSDGDVLTVQADGSLAVEAASGGSSAAGAAGTIQISDGAGNLAAAGITVANSAQLLTGAGGFGVWYGFQNFNALTSGSYNSGIGYQNFYSATSCSYDSGIGYLNFYNLTSGNYHTGIGRQNFYNLTSGDYDVGIGRQNFSSLTSGSYDTAIGHNNFYSATSGSYDSGIGYQNFYSLGTASHDTGIGYQNFYNATSGIYDIGIGYRNFYNLTSGDYCVGIGTSCGAGLTSATDAIVIGRPATMSGTLTNTFWVETGNGAVVHCVSNSTGFAVGHKTPTEKLDVDGNVVLTALSSTSTRRARARIQSAWVNSTDATRTARFICSAYDTAEREVMRGEASGTAPLIGFLGASAVARQSVGAAATDAASTQTLANNLRTALINLGLCTT